ncbi:hypothetical protein A2U01_0110057, partial [Trifolium medium]|nr:hypothetical protein [Trifolium medium]
MPAPVTCISEGSPQPTQSGKGLSPKHSSLSDASNLKKPISFEVLAFSLSKFKAPPFPELLP